MFQEHDRDATGVTVLLSDEQVQYKAGILDIGTSGTIPPMSTGGDRRLKAYLHVRFQSAILQ